MTINAAGKCISPLFLILQESNGHINPIVVQKLANISTPNLFIRCTTPGKNNKQLTGEYFEKIRKSTDGVASRP